MKKTTFLFCIVCLLGNVMYAQSTYVPISKEYYHLIDRYEIKLGQQPDNLHSSWKPYPRKSVATLADSVRKDSLNLSQADHFNLDYLTIDNWEWARHTDVHISKKPLWKRFYPTQSDFFLVNTEDFEWHVSPVLQFSMGHEPNRGKTPYINTRGIEMRGMINKKIGFYSFMSENQALYPDYVMSGMEGQWAVPGEGFWKRYHLGGTFFRNRERSFIPGDEFWDRFKNGVDFFTARGYITVDATKNIHVQFGHDRHFIGNGYRSLILSDFSNNYLFLKVNTQVWKFNYTNLFAELKSEVDLNSFGARDGLYPRKFLSLHHFSFNVTKNFNIGVYEAIMSGDPNGSRLELNYLNPIIFYRAIEQQIGSADNAKVGADFKWNFLKRFSLYGQWSFDEFLLAHIKARNGWWANKYAGQLGLKYIDVLGIDNLDLQLESNFARPFMYTHNSNFTNFTHYNQPLMHPLGANFKENIAILRYQPFGKLNLTAKFIWAKFGTDEMLTLEDGTQAESNYGQNIFKSYTDHTKVFDNYITQGISNDMKLLDLTASYQLRHNLFIDLRQIHRNLVSEDEARNHQTAFTSIGLRLNIAPRHHDF
jgi:hypothetical protein